MTTTPSDGSTGAVDGTPAAVPPEPGSGAGSVISRDLEEASELFGMDWPDQAALELPALAIAVGSARDHARQALRKWELVDLIGPAVQIVSELVTNSVRASEGLTTARFDGRWTVGSPSVRLWLSAGGGQLLIQVWDGDRRLPKPSVHEDLAAEHGRGLLLVETFCERYGVYRLKGASGKVVWAVCHG